MAPRNPKIDPNVIEFDMRGVEPRREGGKAAHVPPGDYLLEVVKAEAVAIKSGADAGKPQIAWQMQIKAVGVENAHDPEALAGIGDVIYLNTKVKYANPKTQGWFLRNLLMDLLGADTTGNTGTLRLDDKAGKRVAATLVDGKPYTKIDDDGNEVTTIRSEIKYTYPADKFVGAGGAQEGAPAPTAKANGVATPEQAKAAIEEPDADEEEMEELAVQSL